jgi:multimeric flavodoxin WrbA
MVAGNSWPRPSHRLRLAHLHGQRQLAVQEVRRRVVQSPGSARPGSNKLAAGFTNSATLNGDKLSTLHYLFTLSQQHSMLWVGTGMMPVNAKAATRDDINNVGGYVRPDDGHAVGRVGGRNGAG